MADGEENQLLGFLESGIYRFSNLNAAFIDPVRILNLNYTRFRVSPSAYYSRFFNSAPNSPVVLANSRKRKRNQKNKNNKKNDEPPCALNEKEMRADERHQEIRHLLVKAHGDFLGAKELLDVISEINCQSEGWEPCKDFNSNGAEEEVSFVELGKVWQAPLYEIALDFNQDRKRVKENGEDEVVAEFLTSQYILPKESCFYMSDLGQMHNLIPADPDCGFNFILIDPPWENRSAYQKSKYLTLPNRYFLSIPIRQLTHTRGALVALWVTNREKLRNFVENELFPAWGVRYMSTLYWLKVKADGSLICDLDLFHHRPYECLLLGYSGREVNDSELLTVARSLKDYQVMITIPGDYSRKPPVGELLLDYVPGPKPARCIELFAREMMAGWTSWGNEPLHFQESRYFSRKMTEKYAN